MAELQKFKGTRQGLDDALEEIDWRKSLQTHSAAECMDFWKPMGELAEAGLLAGELDQRVEIHRG